MAVPARISIVTLGVADVARAARFYEALGWRRAAASTDEICWFATADSVLGLFSYDSLAADAHLPVADPRPSFGGVTLAINLDTEEAVTAAFDEAVAAGAAPVKRPEKTPWGGFSGYFADPDGHPWELAHNPFFAITPSGSLDLGG